jgi:murein DD-endopeptidase MepM/ murein hydrolase activator NlpD
MRVQAVSAIVVALGSVGAGTARPPIVLHRHVEAEARPAGDPVTRTGPDATSFACPLAALPDGDACVRIPGDDEGPEAELAENAHHDKRGRWVVYDQIPRRPERPADYGAYRYPVVCESANACVVSGYDLDRPDEMQRRGRRLSHVGHGAVDIPQHKGTPIAMLPLEHQEGDADVVYVGPLFGTTVVTRHALREGGQLRDYLLLFGHLDALAPGLNAGARLKEGDLVGFVGDTGSPELVHLHLEARRVRDGVDVGKLLPGAMIANENSVVCDPRNVLPLR